MFELLIFIILHSKKQQLEAKLAKICLIITVWREKKFRVLDRVLILSSLKKIECSLECLLIAVKKQGMWKNNKFVEESLTMIYLGYSRWLNVGRWWKFWSKCLQWWHVKIRWWVLEILRNWWLRNIDLFP